MATYHRRSCRGLKKHVEKPRRVRAGKVALEGGGKVKKVLQILLKENLGNWRRGK